MQELRAAIVDFVDSCRRPVLSEPGEELLALRGDNLTLDLRSGGLYLQAWDDHRSITRRVTRVESKSRSKLVLGIERFGKKAGTLALVDLDRPRSAGLERQTARQEFRETFRRLLRREFPGCPIEELTTEANLEHSLSPVYPRALLRQGSSGFAAIAAPEGASDGVLSFGLIWLDYLRRRNPRLPIRGLVLFLPAGEQMNTCLRIRWLDPQAISCSVLIYSAEGDSSAVDWADAGNIDTRLDRCPAGAETNTVTRASNLMLDRKHCSRAQGLHPPGVPEHWLESQVRTQIEQLDATLRPEPVYGQVPALAARDRGIMDLLAVDWSGRLAVIEMKASEDIHLPLQALDYWIRVTWHLGKDEFTRNGYFPGIALCTSAPRLMLVAPALAFHPTNERVLRFLSPAVEAERIGLGVQSGQRPKVMYRM